MSSRRIFIAYLLASVLSACADSESGSEQTLVNGSADPESAANAIVGRALALNSVVSTAFGRVKDDLPSNQFLFFEEIQRSLQESIWRSDRFLDHTAEELLEQSLPAEEPVLTAKVYGLIKGFAELISVPRESIPVKRLANFLDDSLKVESEICVILIGDREERKKAAYYLAPAYNVVGTLHIYALAAAGYVRSSTEAIYRDEIETNLHLLGTGEAGDPGFLSDWVAAQTPGSASAAVKIDHDPIIYSIRRSIEEQQRALE